MGGLPVPLRSAWLRRALVVRSRHRQVLVDARAVSIETKRLLEQVAGLQFRQGLIEEVRLVHSSVPDAGEGGWMGESARVVAETIFGEAIEADAVVLCVGLSIGGSLVAGQHRMEAGRYGEITSCGLRESLERLGAEYAESVFVLGPCFAGDPLAQGGRVAVADALAPVGLATADILPAGKDSGLMMLAGDSVFADAPAWAEGIPAGSTRTGARDDGSGVEPGGTSDPRTGGTVLRLDWPEYFPPAPHWDDAVRDSMSSRSVVHGQDGEVVLAPDAVTTDETRMAPGATGSGLGPKLTLGEAHPSLPAGSLAEDNRAAASRLGYAVSALRVVNLTVEGRLVVRTPLPAACDGLGRLSGDEREPGERPEGSRVPVWVAGRAAGAETYLQSLRSAVRVAEDVARSLGGVCRGEELLGANTGSSS